MCAFEDEGLKKAFSRYSLVVEGRAKAKYIVAKGIAVKKPKNLKNAWEEHRGALEKMRTALESNTPIRPATFSLLDLKHHIAKQLIQACCLCERKCGVDRRENRGFCGVGEEARISSAFVHTGEEPELVPSGTIFFNGCTFRCAFCQNWDISQFPEGGEEWTQEEIGGWIDRMKGQIINVNLVGGEPTPNLHNILGSLRYCNANLPIVWNSNMYMSAQSMKLLEGIVDLFLADFKYGNDECALRFSEVPDYFNAVSRNHLLASEHAELLIRHLIMPNHLECCTKPILNWIRRNLNDKARVNLMSQYRPVHKAREHEDIARRITVDEYEEAVLYSKKIGLRNVEIQGPPFPFG